MEYNFEFQNYKMLSKKKQMKQDDCPKGLALQYPGSWTRNRTQPIEILSTNEEKIGAINVLPV